MKNFMDHKIVGEFIEKMKTVDMRALNLKNVAMLFENSDTPGEETDEPVMWVETIDGKRTQYAGENDVLNKMRGLLTIMDTLERKDEDRADEVAGCDCEECKPEPVQRLEFRSLRDEEFRVYDWCDGTDPVIINNPVALNVSQSGGHRVLDADGISHYIPSGWYHLYWKVKPGCEPFAF